MEDYVHVGCYEISQPTTTEQIAKKWFRQYTIPQYNEWLKNTKILLFTIMIIAVVSGVINTIVNSNYFGIVVSLNIVIPFFAMVIAEMNATIKYTELKGKYS